MHFVSAQTEEDQIVEIITFMRDHLRESLPNQKLDELNGFEDKL